MKRSAAVASYQRAGGCACAPGMCFHETRTATCAICGDALLAWRAEGAPTCESHTASEITAHFQATRDTQPRSTAGRVPRPKVVQGGLVSPK